MSAQCDLVIEVDVRILVALVAGKTGRNQGFRQLGGPGDLDRFAVQPSAFALLCRKQLVASGVVQHTRNALLFVLQGDGNAKDRKSMGKIGGAVERVNIPAVIAVQLSAGALFPNDVMFGPV